MGTELVVKADLDAAIQEVIDVGLTDVYPTREEVMQLIVRFYGAVLTAVQYMVITPEEAQYLHTWLSNNLEL